MGENYEASSAEEENEMADLGFLEPISDEMDPLGMTGKIAGKPIWIHPSLSLSSNDTICGVCNEASMRFLLQINAPGDEDDTPHAAYRTLYVYCCPKASCLQESQPSKAIHIWAGNSNPFGYVASSLCKLCGLNGTIKSEGTEDSNDWYCSSECQQSSHSNLTKPWKEWSLYTEPEETPKIKSDANLQSSTNSDDEVDNEEEEEDDDELPDPTPLVDAAFIEFQERISWYPRQVIRYNRLDDIIPPLWVSDEGKPDETKDIPSCSICKSPRTCEFQIMSTIIAPLGIDDDSLSSDFGTIAIYTCPKNCIIPPPSIESKSTTVDHDNNEDDEKPPQGFTCEVAWKQDFSSHGINLYWKRETEVPTDTTSEN